MERKQNTLKLPCNCLPLVGETNYMIARNPTIHCDRTADFHVLIYLISGNMEIIEEGETYELTPDTIFFLKAGLHHTGKKYFGANSEWYYVHFYTNEPKADWDELKEESVLSDGKVYHPEDYERYLELPKMIHLPSENAIKGKIETVVQLFQSRKRQNRIRLGTQMWEALLAIQEWQERSILEIKMDQRIQKVIDFVKENYTRNFSSQEIVIDTGLSYKYISTLFKQELGITIKQYQIRLRISKAEWYLQNTDMSMNEIAQELGFYDAFSFSKRFKRENGSSPLHYRNHYIPRM